MLPGKRLHSQKWLIGPFKWYGHSLIFGNKWQGANQDLLSRREEGTGMPMSTPCAQRDSAVLSVGSGPSQASGCVSLWGALPSRGASGPACLLCRLQRAIGPRLPGGARWHELWSQETQSTEHLVLSFSGLLSHRRTVLTVKPNEHYGT